MAGRLRFLGCNKSLAEARAVFCGTWLSGENEGDKEKKQEHAPDIIRAYSRHTDDYHIITGKNISAMALHDIGNVPVPVKEDHADFSPLMDQARTILDANKLLFTVGEEREISYALIKAAQEKYKNLKVVTIDAHHGRETAEKKNITAENYLSHCIKEFLAPENILQLGIRCGSKESYDSGVRKHRHLPPRVKRGVIERLPRLYHFPVYLTIDLDVIEPCFAPGIKYPIPGGISVPELIEAIRYFESVSIIGADIMGINLQNDVTDITSALVCALAKECYIYFLANNQYTT